MPRTPSGDHKEALDMADERERDAEAEQKAIDDAEHTISVMLQDSPSGLIAMFHNHATCADLDAMDLALVSYLKSLGENQSSAFYDALLRIVEEHGNE